jgi:tRNA A-37 threonylcarbamoyl transferase component Bud32
MESNPKTKDKRQITITSPTTHSSASENLKVAPE